MTAKTATSRIDEIFSLSGQTGYVHSNNGPAFLSKELYEHLLNTKTERDKASHPHTTFVEMDNEQVERYIVTIWRGIQLALDTDGLKQKYWEIMDIPLVYSYSSS